MHSRPVSVARAATGGAALLLAATLTSSCSALGSLSPGSSPSESQTSSPTATATPEATATDDSMPVNPNTATEEQIRTALEHAGVQDADRIAKEIKAHAPYTRENIASKIQDLVVNARISPSDIQKIREALNL